MPINRSKIPASSLQLCNVSPRFPSTDLANCCVANTESVCQALVGFARFFKCSYFLHTFVSQFRKMLRTASRFLAPSLFVHIYLIVPIRSHEEMFRIKTWRIIARMKNMKFRFNIEPREHRFAYPRYSVVNPINFLLSVPLGICAPSPFPTVRSGNVSMFQKKRFYFFNPLEREVVYLATKSQGSIFPLSFIVHSAKTFCQKWSSAVLYRTDPLIDSPIASHAQTIGSCGGICKSLLFYTFI